MGVNRTEAGPGEDISPKIGQKVHFTFAQEIFSNDLF